MTNFFTTATLLRHTLIALALTFSTAIHAEQTFTVDSTLDQIDDDVSDGLCRTAAGTCTLRAAIMQANRSSGAGATIILPAGTYTLIRPRTPGGGELDGDLDLTTPASGNPVIRIVGAGRSTTIIDAAQIDRAMVIALNRTVTINSVTIRNGYVPAGSHGAGIFNQGTLTLDNTLITGCTGAFPTLGGAIFNWGSLAIKDSSLSSNSAGQGGGIHNQGPDLTLENSTITHNSAYAWCGGICITSGQVRITRSTIAYNNALSAGGLSINSGVSVLITNSTIAGNQAIEDGGGIWSAGTANIFSSTIAGNMANSDPSPDWWGSGGGVFVDRGTFNIRNTLVASNYTGGGADPDDCNGIVKSYGRNLFGDRGQCGITTVTGSWDLLSWGSLGNLGDNGGPTPTIALLAGSNAIDAATLDGGCRDDGGPLPTDQRGLQRVGDCDVGAFEYGAFDPDLIFRHGFE